MKDVASTVMPDELSRHISCNIGTSLNEEFEWLHGNRSAPVRTAEAVEYARRVEELDEDSAPAALCLSGGGIRSATFCLGAIQGMAKIGLLERFHYLSLVSGGGYIGAWLLAWIQRAGLQAVIAALAGGAAATRQAPLPSSPAPVDRLRAYTNYLSPVWGLSIDALTLAAIFLRNLFLHWTALLPWLCILLLLPRLQVAMQASHASWPMVAAVGGLAALMVVVAVAYIAADLPGDFTKAAEKNASLRPRNLYAKVCMPALFVAALLLSWAGAWLARGDVGKTANDWLAGLWLWQQGPRGPNGAALWSWTTVLVSVFGGGLLHVVAAGIGWWLRPWRGLTRRRYTFPKRALAAAFTTGGVGGLLLFGFFCGTANLRLHAILPAAGEGDVKPGWLALYTLLSVPALLLVFWLAVTVYVGSMSRLTSEEDREWWSRSSATSLSWSLGWAVLVLSVVLLPYWLLQLPLLQELSAPAPTVGVFTAVLGGIISLIGFWSQRGPALKRQVDGFVSRLGMRMLDVAALSFVVLLMVVGSLAASWALHRIPVPASVGDQSARDARDLLLTRNAAWLTTNNPSVENEPQQRSPVTEATACKKSGQTCVQLMPAGWVDPSLRYALVLIQTPPWCLIGIMLGLALFGWGAMRSMGVNTFSLHAMYGNRLVRAYLGASREGRRPHWFTGFDQNDNMPMAALQVRERRLFPVINVALNLAEAAGDRLEWQQRKAASFTITPLRCGSSHLGFVSTAAYGRAPRAQDPARPRHAAVDALEPAVDQSLGGVTLGRAMATSGAAASPNMGYHTSKLVAFAMSFFNVRLGWWLPNPMPKFTQKWATDDPPNGLWNMLAEAAAQTSSKRPFVYLSDGGHFENLGLYEMVRRRCRRIVVIDATADPTYGYADLEGSIRKIRIDHGAEVAFDKGLPSVESVRRTGCHFAVGRVTYPGSKWCGTIIYFKPALSGDEPLDVQRYATAQKRRGASFPHDPTSHQNFDEAQFESYRMLGWHSIIQAFAQDDSWQLLKVPDHRPPPPGAGTPAAPQVASTAPGSASSLSTRLPASAGLRNLAAGAVIGTVAVTGTVALTDKVVELKNPDLRLASNTVSLREGSTVALAPGRLEVDAQLQAALDALARGIGGPGTTSAADSETLIRAIDELRKALSERTPNDNLQLQINQLRVALQQQQAGPNINVNVEVPVDVQNQLRNAAAAIGRVAVALERAASQSEPHGTEVAEALRAIARAVRATAPRSNVSGTGEGGRP